MLQNKKYYLLLHLLLFLYSLAGIFSKKAAIESFLSSSFLFYYLPLIFILVIYAIGWQQVIKVLPLSTAFANKAVTVIWALVWGKLIFNENITAGKLIGVGFIIAGIVLFSYLDKSVANER